VEFQLHLDTESVERTHPAEIVSVAPQATVREVLELLKEHQDGSVVVCRDEKLVGIFTERDALRLMAAEKNLDVPLEQVMTSDVVTISNTDTVKTAITKMSKGGYRRLPVIDLDGRPVGMLKVSSILHYLVQHVPNSVYNLPPSPHQTTQHREGA
jgi:CBS domain-containing protein